MRFLDAQIRLQELRQERSEMEARSRRRLEWLHARPPRRQHVGPIVRRLLARSDANAYRTTVDPFRPMVPKT